MFETIDGISSKKDRLKVLSPLIVFYKIVELPFFLWLAYNLLLCNIVYMLIEESLEIH